MPKKTIIGFEVDKEFKERLVKAANNHKMNGVPYPLKISGFCRIATEILIRKVEEELKEGK